MFHWPPPTPWAPPPEPAAAGFSLQRSAGPLAESLERVGKCLFRQSGSRTVDAIVSTAQRTGFGGRWQQICDSPVTIVDIGHNEHGLKYNFAQLQRMKDEGRCTHIIIVYGSVADKDVDSVIHLMPEDATYIFTQAHGKRALAASVIKEKYLTFCSSAGRGAGDVHVAADVAEAVALARQLALQIVEADPSADPLIYIGGSTYVVSEAIVALK